MVSFSCAQCGDIIKKPKIKQHIMQCWTAGFSCVDCNQQFDTTAVNDHKECVSEIQRYAGKWMEKQAAAKNQRKKPEAEAPKRKRSPVKELSSPEWTPEDKPLPAPKRVKTGTPQPSPKKSPAAAPAPVEKKKKEKKDKVLAVTLPLGDAALPVQLARKKAAAAKGDAAAVTALVQAAVAKLVAEHADGVVAAVEGAL